MNVSIRYSTHLPVLLECMKRTEGTKGDVLELGPGVFSTPILHWLCREQGRRLVTIEQDPLWMSFCNKYYRRGNHRFQLVDNYDQAKIEQPWDVVLVDHSPAPRRAIEIKRLANLAKYIVVHDAEDRHEPAYQYSAIYPLFKSRYLFTEVEPHTVVLSNFVDLKDFSVYG